MLLFHLLPHLELHGVQARRVLGLRLLRLLFGRLRGILLRLLLFALFALRCRAAAFFTGLFFIGLSWAFRLLGLFVDLLGQGGAVNRRLQGPLLGLRLFLKLLRLLYLLLKDRLAPPDLRSDYLSLLDLSLLLGSLQGHLLLLDLLEIDLPALLHDVIDPRERLRS